MEHMQPWEEGQQRQEEEEEDWEAAEAVLKAASELSSQSGNLLLGAYDQASAAEGADTRADVRRRGRAVLADEAEDSDGDESEPESEGGSGDADAKEGEQGPRHVLHSGAIPGTQWNAGCAPAARRLRPATVAHVRMPSQWHSEGTASHDSRIEKAERRVHCAAW